MYFSKDADSVPTFKFPGSTGAGPRHQGITGVRFPVRFSATSGSCLHQDWEYQGPPGNLKTAAPSI